MLLESGGLNTPNHMISGAMTLSQKELSTLRGIILLNRVQGNYRPTESADEVFNASLALLSATYPKVNASSDNKRDAAFCQVF